MNKTTLAVVELVITKATADQVRRTLDVMRIRGWQFPEQCEVGVKVLYATALVTQVTARIDDVTAASININTQTPKDDITKMVDALVGGWLGRHGTEKTKTGVT